MDTKEIECCIRGYHVYRDIWEAAVDEELVCRPERSNAHDRYAVAVMKIFTGEKIRVKNFRPLHAWAKKAKILSGRKFPAIR